MTDMAKTKKPVIRLDDDDFGAVLNWAVRYCLGRMTYAPLITTEFIVPLLPFLSDKTIQNLDQDVSDHRRRNGGFGAAIDDEVWVNFLTRVKRERERRKANV